MKRQEDAKRIGYAAGAAHARANGRDDWDASDERVARAAEIAYLLSHPHAT